MIFDHAETLPSKFFAFNPVLFKRVEGIGFSARPANRLRIDGVTYLGELIQKTESDLLHNSNFGL